MNRIKAVQQALDGRVKRVWPTNIYAATKLAQEHMLAAWTAAHRQVLRDVENTLRYPRDDGVIVLHDRNPANASIACPATSYADFRAQNHWWNINWSGDVWKAIVYLRSTRRDCESRC